MEIQLNSNGGKVWQSFGENHIKGFAFYKNKFLSGNDLLNAVLSAIYDNNLNSLLLELNGNFSIVCSEGISTYLIADKMKTYPLLYLRNNHNFFVSDQAKAILDCDCKLTFDEESVITYIPLGYLHGDSTLLQNCKIVAAGTYVVLGDSATVVKYHEHIYEKTESEDIDVLIEKAEQQLEKAINRMLISIGDRPIWIPLSGGYDSRLLACVLKKLNVPNVNCFTYGISSSYEVQISRQVAEALGFKWHFIEYNDSNIAEISTHIDYFISAMNLNSTSHYQDFVAIKELKERNIMPDNAVIVPGHSGEILGRDQVPYHLLDSDCTLADLLYYRYYTRNELKGKYKRYALASLGNNFNDFQVRDDKSLAIDLFNNWNVQNRQSNFIVNAVRVYEFFNYDWRIPLWDDELSKFWFSISTDINRNVEFYNHFLFTVYFKPLKVDFYKKSYASGNFISKIRLPFGIKYKIKYYLTKFSFLKGMYDFNNLNRITEVIDNKLVGFRLKYIKARHKYSDSSDTLFLLFLLTKKIK